MPYAANNQISTEPIDGGIEITAEQYHQAIAGMRAGKIVTIGGGFAVIDPPKPEAPPVPVPTFGELKEAKRAEITRDCLLAIDGGFEHDGHIFDSDQRSQSNIIGTATGVAANVPLPEGFTWRTKDNQNVPMDAAGVIALGAALLRHVNSQYAISWQLKADLEAATTPEELDAISWPEPAA